MDLSEERESIVVKEVIRVIMHGSSVLTRGKLSNRGWVKELRILTSPVAHTSCSL